MRVSSVLARRSLSRRPGWRTAGLMLLTGLMLFCPACGSDQRKPVFPVRGKVLFEGRATPQAYVVFHPVDGDPEAPRPQAYVDRDGSFQLSTYHFGDGAPAGDYIVTVEWRTFAPVRNVQEGDSLPTINRLPTRYASTRTSGLRVRVGPTTNEPTLTLTR